MKKRNVLLQQQFGPKKVGLTGAALKQPVAGEAIRLQYGGERLELTPTAKYPILVILTEDYETWIAGIVDMKCFVA